jgi:hypothetical protein
MSENPSLKVRLPAPLLAAVDHVAQSTGCDRSEAIRYLLFVGLTQTGIRDREAWLDLRDAWSIVRKGAD